MHIYSLLSGWTLESQVFDRLTGGIKKNEQSAQLFKDVTLNTLTFKMYLFIYLFIYL